jgi:hypothetical protein
MEKNRDEDNGTIVRGRAKGESRWEHSTHTEDDENKGNLNGG